LTVGVALPGGILETGRYNRFTTLLHPGYGVPVHDGAFFTP